MTPRQLEVLRYVEQYLRAHEYAPTLREIAAEFGISRVTALTHLRKLEAGRFIRRRGYRHRAIEVLRPSGKLRVIGRIAAGRPIEAIEDVVEVDVPEGGDGDTFALRVEGESMIEDQIRPGDIVICRRAAVARNGETVVALLDGGEATLKKFYREGRRVRLQPANESMKPMIVDRVTIQGVVVGLYRDYRR